MLNPEPKRPGFQYLRTGPADVNVSEKNVWSLLQKNILLLKNFGNNASKSSFFPVPIMARKGTLPANVLKMPFPGQRITSPWRYKFTFANVHVTDDDISFCDGPGLLIRKTVKPCINSMWIALLIHVNMAVNSVQYSILCNNLR